MPHRGVGREDTLAAIAECDAFVLRGADAAIAHRRRSSTPPSPAPLRERRAGVCSTATRSWPLNDGRLGHLASDVRGGAGSGDAVARHPRAYFTPHAGGSPRAATRRWQPSSPRRRRGREGGGVQRQGERGERRRDMSAERERGRRGGRARDGVGAGSAARGRNHLRSRTESCRRADPNLVIEVRHCRRRVRPTGGAVVLVFAPAGHPRRYRVARVPRRTLAFPMSLAVSAGVPGSRRAPRAPPRRLLAASSRPAASGAAPGRPRRATTTRATSRSSARAPAASRPPSRSARLDVRVFEQREAFELAGVAIFIWPHGLNHLRAIDAATCDRVARAGAEIRTIAIEQRSDAGTTRRRRSSSASTSRGGPRA